MPQSPTQTQAPTPQRSLFMTIGVLESYSYLMLVLIAMPLKYIWGLPQAVRYVGMAHGLLFVLYIIALLRLWQAEKLPFITALKGGIASLVPLGPHWFNGFLRKNHPIT